MATIEYSDTIERNSAGIGRRRRYGRLKKANHKNKKPLKPKPQEVVGEIQRRKTFHEQSSFEMRDQANEYICPLV